MNERKKIRKHTSIDGFTPMPRQYRQGTKASLNTFNRYHRPSSGTGSAPGVIRNVGTINRSIDGFTSTSQSVIRSSSHKQKSADIMQPFSKSSQERLQQPAAKPSYSSPRRRTSHAKDMADKTAKKGLLARHKQKAKSKKEAKLLKGRKPRLRLRIAASLGVLLLLIGGGLALRAWLLSRNIFKGGGNSALLHNQDIDPSKLNVEGDGRINVLILGKGGPEQNDGPDLTDTIIVVSIDPIADEAALLSVPRDFWVKSPTGGQSKINQVYYDSKQGALKTFSYNQRDSSEAKEAGEKAGIDGIKKVVSETMGIPIHYHGMIDFAGFRKAIDTVGGIDINVTEDMAVSETMWLHSGRYKLDVKPGWQHFDGTRALAFSRSRKTSSKGDFARSERQRAVIVGLKDKATSMSTLANPVKLNQLMSDFENQLSTDFSSNEILRLYDLIKEVPSDKVTSLGLDEYVSGSMIGGLSVQVPKAGLFDYSEIHNYIRNTMRDSFLKKEDAKIVILNGTTTPGLATKKNSELKSYGYNIKSVGDAPSNNYSQTILVDLKGGINKYTKNYLEKRLGVTAVSSLPDNSIDATDADFVIILGSNETNSSQN